MASVFHHQGPDEQYRPHKLALITIILINALDVHASSVSDKAPCRLQSETLRKVCSQAKRCLRKREIDRRCEKRHSIITPKPTTRAPGLPTRYTQIAKTPSIGICRHRTTSNDMTYYCTKTPSSGSYDQCLATAQINLLIILHTNPLPLPLTNETAPISPVIC
jgi:hypothetical protein